MASSPGPEPQPQPQPQPAALSSLPSDGELLGHLRRRIEGGAGSTPSWIREVALYDHAPAELMVPDAATTAADGGVGWFFFTTLRHLGPFDHRIRRTTAGGGTWRIEHDHPVPHASDPDAIHLGVKRSLSFVLDRSERTGVLMREYVVAGGAGLVAGGGGEMALCHLYHSPRGEDLVAAKAMEKSLQRFKLAEDKKAARSRKQQLKAAAKAAKEATKAAKAEQRLAARKAAKATNAQHKAILKAAAAAAIQEALEASKLASATSAAPTSASAAAAAIQEALQASKLASAASAAPTSASAAAAAIQEALQASKLASAASAAAAAPTSASADAAAIQEALQASKLASAASAAAAAPTSASATAAKELKRALAKEAPLRQQLVPLPEWLSSPAALSAFVKKTKPAAPTSPATASPPKRRLLLHVGVHDHKVYDALEVEGQRLQPLDCTGWVLLDTRASDKLTTPPCPVA